MQRIHASFGLVREKKVSQLRRDASRRLLLLFLWARSIGSAAAERCLHLPPKPIRTRPVAAAVGVHSRSGEEDDVGRKMWATRDYFPRSLRRGGGGWTLDAGPSFVGYSVDARSPSIVTGGRRRSGLEATVSKKPKKSAEKESCTEDPVVGGALVGRMILSRSIQVYSWVCRPVPLFSTLLARRLGGGHSVRCSQVIGSFTTGPHRQLSACKIP